MRPFTFIGFFFLAASCSYAAPPTFGDLAVFVAKGCFSGHVRPDASLEQCVAFLNSKGVYFSLFDLMDPNKAATQEDYARVVGQSTRLFSGDANVVPGGIKIPEGTTTWIDYCLLNDIALVGWGSLVLCTAEGPLPEVKRWLSK